MCAVTPLVPRPHVLLISIQKRCAQHRLDIPGISSHHSTSLNFGSLKTWELFSKKSDVFVERCRRLAELKKHHNKTRKGAVVITAACN